LRADDRERPEVLVLDARDRADFFAVRVPLVFVALGRDRAGPAVRLAPAFFEAARLLLAAFFPVGLPDRDRDERAEASPPREVVAFEFASRTSRTSSMPVATAPRIMPARSSCLTAARALPMARGRAAIFRGAVPFVRF
jgi:hypothetical protein